MRIGTGLLLCWILASFCTSGSAAEVILFEDFDDASDERWGGGANFFGSANGSNNFSNSPHSGVIGGGGRYGTLVAGLGASPANGPLVSAAYTLTTDQVDSLNGLGLSIDFDGWLASEVGDDAYTVFFADLYESIDGSGPSFGTLVLASGLENVGVVTSVGANGELGADWNIDNWSLYQTSQILDDRTRSLTISYQGFGSPVPDRAFADQVTVSLSAVAVPEPSFFGVAMGIGGVMTWRRRKASKNLRQPK
ncbi:MAG: hypothetical protein AAF958_08250 [Planctomycetota bacterium]